MTWTAEPLDPGKTWRVYRDGLPTCYQVALEAAAVGPGRDWYVMRAIAHRVGPVLSRCTTLAAAVDEARLYATGGRK